MIGGARLAGRVALSRARGKLANKLLPASVACPCCGWEGRQFYDYHEIGYTMRNVACPRCDSLPRHRYLSFWLTQQFKLKTRSGVALVFAPEKPFASLWAKASRLNVYRVDIEATRGIDMIADMKYLPFRSNSIDLIWCHHVLEHIDDDRASIKELHRVLRPHSGQLVVSVPMAAAATTDEYGFPDPMQSGHWRLYGEDFEARLKETGLTVQAVHFDLPDQDHRRYGFNPERFYIGKKVGISE